MIEGVLLHAHIDNVDMSMTTTIWVEAYKQRWIDTTGSDGKK